MERNDFDEDRSDDITQRSPQVVVPVKLGRRRLPSSPAVAARAGRVHPLNDWRRRAAQIVRAAVVRRRDGVGSTAQLRAGEQCLTRN